MTRGRIIAAVVIGVVAVGLGWALMTTLSRVLRQTDPVVAEDVPQQQTTPSDSPAVPRINAKLFFASEDGRQLVAVEQEIPMAEGTMAQARAIVEAQLKSAAPAPLISPIPEGTGLRGVYVSDRNEAFVDLDTVVRLKHPGGSLNELFTVYAIVNAVTTNLADIQSVQILIDGREVDTLVGHVDLRRPLRKNELLTTP
jgi:hypothetical protein